MPRISVRIESRMCVGLCVSAHLSDEDGRSGCEDDGDDDVEK